jgi:hypothetical protein
MTHIAFLRILKMETLLKAQIAHWNHFMPPEAPQKISPQMLTVAASVAKSSQCGCTPSL